MKKEIKAIAKRVLGSSNPFPKLNPDKKELIDYACQRLDMQSFADLGGVWAVDAGYTFYGMEQHHIGHATLVDTDLTPAVQERSKKHPALKIIEGNFGDPSMPDRVGKVDGVFLFDTLLHQVNPNWDDILRMYARVSRILLIFNQQYTNLPTTTRLLDLGQEEYFRNVPHAADEEPYKTYFRDLDAIHPQHRRPYRDIHNIWQWGIVDTDLLARMSEMGFKLQFYKNCGRFGQLRNVENHAFVFHKSDTATRSH